MNVLKRRAQELDDRVVNMRALQDLKRHSGWLALKSIIQKHIEKYGKMSKKQTYAEDKRVRYLDIQRAMENLLVDIEQRIEVGKSAERTLTKEAAA